ncbi:uncharacterized protein LOC110913552 [Helianthus annuus]|uniref:uncharacterized protein LOC110913552 n=1 Tax=Helianthus annuus TaxID=4232 RepID=UPI000B90190B|nr:uncharacterized protein LOC110913552 [Helianthus annuus]
MNILSLNIRGIVGGAKASWVREVRVTNNIGAIALQESKMESLSKSGLIGYWGNNNFDFAYEASIGLSWGLIWMWDPRIIKIVTVVQNRNYLLIRGSMVGSGVPINLFNIYAPQSVSAKRQLWDNLSSLLSSSDGQWLLAGNFNAVRSQEERKHSNFKVGRKFTCIRDNVRKLNKLDCFLVCSEFFNMRPSACVRALSARHSDHYPIILEVVDLRFGPRPFRVFSSWIGQVGFEEAVREASESFVPTAPPDVTLTSKFSIIRSRLKIWRDEFLAKEKESKNLALAEL